MNKQHPIYSKNEDVVCRWLCFNPVGSEKEIARALAELPFCGQAIKVPYINMLEYVK